MTRRKSDRLPYLRQAARAVDAWLGVADYWRKSAIVGAMIAPFTFYWNPPFWVIALSTPFPAPKAPGWLAVPMKKRPDEVAANDNNRPSEPADQQIRQKDRAA